MYKELKNIYIKIQNKKLFKKNMTKLLKRVAIVSQTGDRTVTYQICSSAQQTHHIKKKKKKKILVNMIIPSFHPADGTATTPIQHQK